MMKGIRGLLEKDFRLFFRQGGNLFLVLVFVALFFILTGKTGAAFIAMYIPSVLAIYSGNTISYDENGHGYTYLFSLPVNKKIYVREKYIFSISLDAAVWLLGLTITTVVSMIGNYGTDLKKLVMIMSWGMMAGVVLIALNIPVRLKFDGEKGRLIIAVIVLFLGGAGVLTGKMCGRLGVNPTGIFQKIVSLSAGQLLGAGMMILVIGLTVSYQCSIKILEKKEY